MLEPCGKPYKKNVEKPSGAADSVSAKGNVKVIPKPASQRNMPPTPELSDAGRYIGVVEIFGKVKSQHFSQPDSHIAVAGKIKIYM